MSRAVGAFATATHSFSRSIRVSVNSSQFVLANVLVSFFNAPMPEERRRAFSPPWQLQEHRESFCIRDAREKTLAYVYFEDESGRRMAMGRLTKDEARRIATHIARLPNYIRRPQY
jgi:hypothetical protein